MDYPAMLTKLDLETNHMFLQLLMEVYTKPKAKLVELRAEKSKRLGRRKIRYPENWPELYDKWKAGEITGRDCNIRLSWGIDALACTMMAFLFKKSTSLEVASYEFQRND